MVRGFFFLLPTFLLVGYLGVIVGVENALEYRIIFIQFHFLWVGIRYGHAISLGASILMLLRTSLEKGSWRGMKPLWQICS